MPEKIFSAVRLRIRFRLQTKSSFVAKASLRGMASGAPRVPAGHDAIRAAPNFFRLRLTARWTLRANERCRLFKKNHAKARRRKEIQKHPADFAALRLCVTTKTGLAVHGRQCFAGCSMPGFAEGFAGAGASGLKSATMLPPTAAMMMPAQNCHFTSLNPPCGGW